MCSANSEVIGEVKEEIKPQDPLNVGSYFPALIYIIERFDFLER